MEIGKRIHASVLQPANVLSLPLNTEGSSVCAQWTAQIIDVLSVLFLVLFALACGAVSSTRKCGGVTGGLQMVKQLVS